MITPYDVPASKLIDRLARYLRENVDAVQPPAWVGVVKTGEQAQKQPMDPNWWYTRCASVLRKVFTQGPIGIQKLRSDYGGGKRHGVIPQHAAKGGGSIVRKALQQLQTAGLIEPVSSRGRRVTAEGRKLLQELAEEVEKEVAKSIPELEKYAKGE